MEGSAIVARMALDLGFLPRQLEAIVRTAPLRYKVYSVPKKRGGMRVLAQPAREVKALQYWVIRYLRPLLPIHEAASGYEIGCSISKNASLHVDSLYLLKMDFTNFFPSLFSSDFKNHFRLHQPDELTDTDLDALCRILFWAQNRSTPLRLCIGAPSSPYLSNTLLFEFDDIMANLCRDLRVTYSRYADDLAFSTSEKNILGQIEIRVRDVIRNLPYPRLSINNSKTINVSKAQRRVVTGIVLTPDGSISVGRDRKREIRAMYFRWRMGQLDADSVVALRGYLAFVDSIEPGFSFRLERSFARKLAPPN